MSDSRVQGRPDFTPAFTSIFVIQLFQLMRMLVQGACHFEGHPSWASVAQRPTYGRYSDECQAAQHQPAVVVRRDLNA
jgi:hypothetical protein